MIAVDLKLLLENGFTFEITFHRRMHTCASTPYYAEIIPPVLVLVGDAREECNDAQKGSSFVTSNYSMILCRFITVDEGRQVDAYWR